MKKLSLLAAASTLFIAGTAFADIPNPGGWINIDNQSTHTMIFERDKLIDPGMDNWDFQNYSVIKPSFLAHSYIEFDRNAIYLDKGEADFLVSCTKGNDTYYDEIKFTAYVTEVSHNSVPHVDLREDSQNCVNISPNYQNVWQHNITTIVTVTNS